MVVRPSLLWPGGGNHDGAIAEATNPHVTAGSVARQPWQFSQGRPNGSIVLNFAFGIGRWGSVRGLFSF